MAALFLTDPTDDREKLKDLKGSIVDGTCRWIESNGLYNSWLRSDSQLLWLSGGPGYVFPGQAFPPVDLPRGPKYVAEATLFMI